MNIEFPQFRKLSDKSYYKIVSFNEMIELQRIGTKIIRHHLIVSSFLDRNLIHDLLDQNSDRYQVCEQAEFEEKEKSVE